MKSCKFFMGIALACILAAASPALAHHEMHGGHHMMGQGCCDEGLSAEKKKMVEGAMHQSMEKNKPLMERMHKLHEKMRAVAEADKFDKKAFVALGDEMAALHMKMDKNRTDMMASVGEQLTGDERRAMAKCMEGKFHHGEFGHGGWEHGKQGGHSGMDNSHNDYGDVNQ